MRKGGGKRMRAELMKQAEKITNKIYDNYGRGTGWLFGIPPEHRRTNQTLVRLSIEFSDILIGCKR